MTAKLHYLVVETSMKDGGVYRETEIAYAERGALIRDLIDGQYDDPIRIVAFDPEASDVSAEIAKAVSDLAWSEGSELPEAVVDFCEDCDVLVPEIKRA